MASELTLRTELVPDKPKTFEQIAEDLQTYTETLALVEAQMEEWGKQNVVAGQHVSPLPVEMIQERSELIDHIERIGAELVTKTDACAGVLRRIDNEIDAVKAEVERLKAKRKAYERAGEWLRDYVLRVMQENKWPMLKTALNCLSIRKNGGKQALTVAEARLVPDYLCDLTITLSMVAWNVILENCTLTPAAIGKRIVSTLRTPNNEAIRKALEQPCEECNGLRTVGPMYTTGEPVTCAVCGGSGKATVPGAKLEPRGVTLSVK